MSRKQLFLVEQTALFLWLPCCIDFRDFCPIPDPRTRNPLRSFNGDLILLIYLLEMPAYVHPGRFVTRYCMRSRRHKGSYSLIRINLPFLPPDCPGGPCKKLQLREIVAATPSPAIIFVAVALLLSCQPD